MWLLYIPIEEAYVKIAGARQREKQTTYEMYAKHGPQKKEHETHDPAVFSAWFQAQFKCDPFAPDVPKLPSEITLRRHSNDSRRILDNLYRLTGKDYATETAHIAPYYRL